jgi:hypothetical protein
LRGFAASGFARPDFGCPAALCRVTQGALFGRQDGARWQDAQAQQVSEVTRVGLVTTV